jgi:hypothetical protein
MMDKKELLAKLDAMVEMQDRMNPRIERFMERLLDKHDEEMVMSIATHIGITMLTWCILVIEDRGGDVDDYMKVVLRGVAMKHAEGRAGAQAHDAIVKASVTSGFTCRPRD